MAIVPFPPYVESHKPGKEEAARVLTWEGFEIDAEREPDRDHAYTVNEGFVLLRPAGNG